MASNSTQDSGFGHLKTQVARMLSRGDVESIATALDFEPSTIDKLKKEDEPGLGLVSEMESRAIISKTDASELINTLEKLNLHRAAKHIKNYFSDMKVESDVLLNYDDKKLTAKDTSSLVKHELHQHLLHRQCIGHLPFVDNHIDYVTSARQLGSADHRNHYAFLHSGYFLATEIGIYQHAKRGFQKVTQAVRRRLGTQTGQQTVYPPDEDYKEFLKEVEDHMTMEIVRSVRSTLGLTSKDESECSIKNFVTELRDESILTENDISKLLDALDICGEKALSKNLRASFEGYKRKDHESSGEIGSPTYPFVLENPTENNKIQIRIIEYHEQILSDEAKIRVCHIGKRNGNKGDVKCVLLLGKSGDGKTKMLNSLVNKILGVKWDDPFRYKFQVDEEEALTTSQAEGQTKWISAYYLHGNDIIIVDTPGFCDEQGEIRDNFITEQIYSFFCNTRNIITHVNVVAFVMKAGDRRLNDLQRLVFELVLSLFGNDIEPHLCLLATFSESRSEVLPIVDTANIAAVKFGKTFEIDNISLYYSLHTSEPCITNEHKAKRMAQEDELMSIKWAWADESLSHFLSHLRKSSSITIDKSAHVMERRRQLQEVLNGILEVIKSTVIRLDQLEQDKHAAKRHRLQLLENIYFEYSVTQEIVTRENVSDKALVCHKCQRTCENPCKSSFVILSKAMKRLSIIRGCGVCESNCSVSLHEITDFKYKREETTFLKSSKQLLSENKAANEVINIDDEIEQKTKEAKNTLRNKIKDAKFYVCELQKSALRQNVKTLIEYLQEMIEKEQRHDTSESNRRRLLLLELLNNEMRANRADWCGSEVS